MLTRSSLEEYENGDIVVNNLAEELKKFPIPMKGKKEIEALAPYLQKADENIVASIHGNGPYDSKRVCWFVLTNYNVFMVLKASMMGAPSVIALPLKDIDSAVENRGMLLSQLVLTSKGVHYTLHNAAKAQTKSFVEYFNRRKVELIQQPNAQMAPNAQATEQTVLEPSTQVVDDSSPQPAEHPTSEERLATKEQPKKSAGKKKPGCMTRILQFILLLFILGTIGSLLSDDKDSGAKNSGQKTASPSATNSRVYDYQILSEEHNKLGGAKRFTYEISVPLGLSKDELTQLLTNAAWTLQKKKGASGIWIFAYREDDKNRSGGFSAGRCVLAPDGDWAKAVTSRSNLQVKVDIAEAYTYSEQSFEAGTKLFVKDDATLRNDSGKEIATVKKGAEVTVLEHKRSFVITTAIEDYKVAIGETKGWLYEYDLTTVTPEGKPKNEKEAVVPIKKSPLEQKREWVEDNVIGALPWKWNRQKMVKNLGKYEKFNPDSGNPKVLQMFYFDMTFMVNLLKNEIVTYSYGRTTR